jgi:hypothetical protein
MVKSNVDDSTPTRERALSRWDDEGGASPSRPTAGSARMAMANTLSPPRLLIGFAASASRTFYDQRVSPIQTSNPP